MSVAGIIGTGLIGGSLGAALRGAGWLVRGTDVDPEATAEAVRLGLIDEACSDLPSCLRDVDLVVLSTPVARIVDLLPAVAEHVPDRAVVVDTGSVKRPIVAAMESLRGAERAVGGHPLAGSHQSGPTAARADLFRDQTFVFCPSARTSADTLDRAAAFARLIGAVPTTLSASEHDRSVAVTSHLPQILSSLLAAQPTNRVLEGPGFRDMTRLASSDAVMWRGILLSNRDNVLAAVHDFRGSLDGMAQALATADGEAIEQVIVRGREGVTV